MYVHHFYCRSKNHLLCLLKLSSLEISSAKIEQWQMSETMPKMIKLHKLPSFERMTTAQICLNSFTHQRISDVSIYLIEQSVFLLAAASIISFVRSHETYYYHVTYHQPSFRGAILIFCPFRLSNPSILSMFFCFSSSFD